MAVVSSQDLGQQRLLFIALINYFIGAYIIRFHGSVCALRLQFQLPKKMYRVQVHHLGEVSVCASLSNLRSRLEVTLPGGVLLSVWHRHPCYELGPRMEDISYPFNNLTNINTKQAL
uniref:Uncharacterized protein n=1 Tax=Glossina brevipalpis TaxID=37001 RepID=A0A1A9W8H8_9MUSC